MGPGLTPAGPDRSLSCQRPSADAEKGERVAPQSQGSPLSLVHEFVAGGPDRDADTLLPNQERWRNFRAWCARRYSRVAFPDDFVEVVGSALDAALKRVGEHCPESEALHSWRVFLEEQTDAVEVALLVPYDELRGVSRAAVRTYVDKVVAQARALLPRKQERAVKRHGEQVRRFRLTDHLVEAMDTVSLRDVHESEPINFDDLTYTGDEVRGTEHREHHPYTAPGPRAVTAARAAAGG
jgi:hypothetical protein